MSLTVFTFSLEVCHVPNRKITFEYWGFPRIKMCIRIQNNRMSAMRKEDYQIKLKGMYAIVWHVSLIVEKYQ